MPRRQTPTGGATAGGAAVIRRQEQQPVGKTFNRFADEPKNTREAIARERARRRRQADQRH